MTRAQLSQMLC